MGALLECAIRAEKDGKIDSALSLYGRGLDVDDLVEDFYRGSIRCHLARGEQCEAIKMYRRCQKVLSACLGVEPSPDTKGLYLSLVAS